MLLIFLFPVIGAVLGGLSHRLFGILMRNQLRRQYQKEDAVLWEQAVDPVSRKIMHKLPYVGLLLGFVLGLCFIIAIFLYNYIYLS